MRSRVGQLVALFDRGDEAVAYGCDNLIVLRGPRALIERALSAPGSRLHDAGQRAQAAAYAEALAQPARQLDADLERPVIAQLNVGNTLRCNMRCRYCYNELDTKAVKGSRSRLSMSAATADAMVDAWLAQAAGVEQLAILFIGGESALDLTTVERAVQRARARCRRRGIELTAVLYTNGLAMDQALVRWADDHGVQLVVSLDGPPALHDRNRVLADGSPTARRVLDHIALLVHRSRSVLRRVRTVMTEPGALLPLHRYLFDLGFNDLYVQAAYADDGLGNRDRVTDLKALTDWYAELLLAGVVVAVHPFAAILERLHGRGTTVGSWYPCAAGVASLGIGPDGSFYPCHHFLQEPEHAIGHLRDGFPTASTLRSMRCRVDDREPCRSCWARHLCGGECYHRAASAGLGLFGVNVAACAMRKAYAEAALDLFTRVAARRPSSLQRLLDLDYTVPRPNPQAYEALDLDRYQTP